MHALEWMIVRVNARQARETIDMAEQTVRALLEERRRARIVSERDGKFRVIVVESTNPQSIGNLYVLDRAEIDHPSPLVGLEGRLILRDNGFYIGYYLVSDVA